MPKTVNYEFDPVAGTALLESGLDEPVGSISRVQVFRGGDYSEKGKGTYGPAELASLVETFGQDGHRPPVTLDHATSGPAYGRISKLWVEEDRVFADLESVPQSLREAIENGRYSERSAEIYPDPKSGKLHFRRISFLGAKIPEIKGMEPITLSEAEESQGAALHFSVEAAPGEFESEAPVAGAETVVDPEPTEEPAEEPASPSDPAPAPATPELPAKTAPTPQDLERAAAFAEGAPASALPTVDPDPAGHGAIVEERETQASLGHSHFLFLDAAGNGFSGPPLGRWDWESDTYAAAPVGAHIHLVHNYTVLGAEISPGQFSHAHGLQAYKSVESAGPDQPAAAFEEETAMPEATPAAPAATTPNPELATLREKVASLETEQRMRVFDDRRESLVKSGRITPDLAAKARLFAKGLATSGTPSEFVTFSETEGPKDAISAFVGLLEDLPAQPHLFENISGEPAASDVPDATAEKDAAIKKTADDVRAYQEAHPGTSYAAALKVVFAAK